MGTPSSSWPTPGCTARTRRPCSSSCSTSASPPASPDATWATRPACASTASGWRRASPQPERGGRYRKPTQPLRPRPPGPRLPVAGPRRHGRHHPPPARAAVAAVQPLRCEGHERSASPRCRLRPRAEHRGPGAGEGLPRRLEHLEQCMEAELGALRAGTEPLVDTLRQGARALEPGPGRHASCTEGAGGLARATAPVAGRPGAGGPRGPAVCVPRGRRREEGLSMAGAADKGDGSHGRGGGDRGGRASRT